MGFAGSALEAKAGAMRGGEGRGGGGSEKKINQEELAGRTEILVIVLAASQWKLCASWRLRVCFVFFAFAVSELEVHLTV